MWSETNPFLNGLYEPLANEYVIESLRVEGTIPPELDGALYRTGTNQHFRPLNPDKTHWFDGDGMVHAFRLRDGKASYVNRWVETEGLQAERKAGHALYNGLFAVSGVTQPPLPEGAPAVKIVAGVNVIPIAGRVYALHECSAHYWEIDAKTLETLGTFSFDGRFAGMLTAHPHYDPATGETLFYANDTRNRTLDCFSVDIGGHVTSRHHVSLDASVMIHDFAFTPDWMIFFLGPVANNVHDLDYVPKGRGSISFDPERGSRTLFVNRLDGSTRWLQDDQPFQVTHFLNAYQENGRITVDACLSTVGEYGAKAPLGDVFPFPMPGAHTPFSPPELHRWTIDLGAGTSSHSRVSDWHGEFLRGNEAVAGRRHRYGYLAAIHAPRGEPRGFNCLVKHDYDTGRSAYQRLAHWHDLSPGEPIFVAREGGTDEDDGWVLSVWWDPLRNASELVILNAKDFDGEPAARVKLDHHVPLGFHGNWISSAQIAAGKDAEQRWR